MLISVLLMFQRMVSNSYNHVVIFTEKVE